MFKRFNKASQTPQGRLCTLKSQKGRKATFQALTVTKVVKETADCVSIAFESPLDFTFVPGQYLTLKVDIDGESVRRSYSLCSHAVNEDLCVAVKRVEGGKFSTWAQNVQVGDVIESMPPMGSFVLEPGSKKARNIVCFAAGSGITPMLSIIKTTLSEEPDSCISLFYGNKNSGSIIFKSALEDLKDDYMGRLEVRHVLSREDQGSALLYGRMDKARLEEMTQSFPDIAKADEVFICGPESMIHAASEVLIAAGLKKKQVHFELFTAATSTEEKTATKVEKSSIQHEVTVILDDEETHVSQSGKMAILDAALKAGADVPFACKGAVCCTCRAKVLEGTVNMDLNYSLTDEEVAEGFVLTCHSFPTSEKVVVSYDE